MRKQWTDESFKAEVENVSKSLGHFPSVSELRHMGRNDLSVQITRRGGFLHVAAEIGAKRNHSDSDTGWDGEREVYDKLSLLGFSCEAPAGFRSPFDMVVDGSVRIDVKSAKYAEYGACKGWFYRIGKYVQSDIVVLHELDTKSDYVFFWWEVTATNMTISRGGGKYASAKGAYWKIGRVRDSIIEIQSSKNEASDIMANP